MTLFFEPIYNRSNIISIRSVRPWIRFQIFFPCSEFAACLLRGSRAPGLGQCGFLHTAISNSARCWKGLSG